MFPCWLLIATRRRSSSGRLLAEMSEFIPEHGSIFGYRSTYDIFGETFAIIMGAVLAAPLGHHIACLSHKMGYAPQVGGA